MREKEIQASRAASHVGMAVMILRQIATPRAYMMANKLQALVEFTEKAADDQAGSSSIHVGVPVGGACQSDGRGAPGVESRIRKEVQGTDARMGPLR